MTGFLFGLGLVVTVGQLPNLLGVAAGSGGFLAQLANLVERAPLTRTRGRSPSASAEPSRSSRYNGSRRSFPGR